MSAVIKSGVEAIDGPVRRFDPLAFARAGMPDVAAANSTVGTSVPLGTIERLELENRAFAKRIERFEEQIVETETAAREEGVRRGKKQAQTADAERLGLLEKTAREARADHADWLKTLDTLAAELARMALTRVFESDAPYKDMVEDSLALHLSELDRDLVTTIKLSAKDFADEAALQALGERFCGLAFESAAELPAGGCTIGLTLGDIDASVPGQWKRLSGLLTAMAEGTE